MNDEFSDRDRRVIDSLLLKTVSNGASESEALEARKKIEDLRSKYIVPRLKQTTSGEENWDILAKKNLSKNEYYEYLIKTEKDWEQCFIGNILAGSKHDRSDLDTYRKACKKAYRSLKFD